MQKKERALVREHHGKQERERLASRRRVKAGRGQVLRKKERGRVKRRKWTVNRSPHGNKTAREQRAREQWKRTRTRGGSMRMVERRNGEVAVKKRKRKE